MSLHTSQPSHGLAQPAKEDSEKEESEENVYYWKEKIGLVQWISSIVVLRIYLE